MQSNPYTETPNFPSSPRSSRTGAMDGMRPAPAESEGVVADDAGEFWFWATSDGALKTVDGRELLASLRKGDVPSTALVWKPGWGEWLRAAEVKELEPSISPSARLTTATPKLSPDATHPPPIPKGSGHLAPIIPVASTPMNDKPVTQLLVESEISAEELEPLKITAPPRPKSSAPPPRPARSSGLKAAPIIPAKSTAKNDKPETVDIPLDEIHVEAETEQVAPPSANWKEVAAPKVAHKPEPTPIVPVDSNPKNDPPTGQIDAAEIEFVEEKKATLSDLEASLPPKAAKLGKATMLGMPAATPAAVAEAPKPNFKGTMLGMPAAAPAAAPAPVAEAPKPNFKGTMLGMPAAAPAAAPLPVAPVAAADEPVISEREAATVLRDAIVPVSDPEIEAPTIVKESPLNAPEPLPSWSAEVDAEMVAAQQAAALPVPTPPPPAMARQSYESITPPKKSSMGLLLGGIGMVVVLGGATLAAGLFYFKPWESGDVETKKSAAAAPAESVTPPVAEASTAACTVTKNSYLVSDAVYLGIPPYVAAVAGGDKIAVGFAESTSSAVGLTINPTTLATTQIMKRDSASPITGVVPVFDGDKLSFVVDTDTKLKVTHTVDAKERFTIGMGPKGYARAVGTDVPELLWSFSAEKLTEARVASVEGVGHAVTFRKGGRVGDIALGWLNPDGSKKTELGSIDAGGPRVGTPTIAANDSDILVTFAARAEDSAPWGVRYAKSAHGEVPKSSREFDIPSGGPGKEAISPTATGLSGKRWLVQWTEGPAGQRTVRAQTYDAEMNPLGETIAVSGTDKEAGQGVVAVQGENATAFYMVKAASGYQMWAKALSCK